MNVTDEYTLAKAILVKPGTMKIFVPNTDRITCNRQLAPGCPIEILIPGPLGLPHEQFVMAQKADMHWTCWCVKCWNQVYQSYRFWSAT